mmetsp:Transcript_12699/g.27481  ORF Transcript_12699/g.27481 Transcript_12699/m.27481 type:complete len:271 (-) Transcript_12699:205-1017(-)
MRVTVLARVGSSVNVRAEITPDVSFVSHILCAVMRTTAVTSVACWRFATIFQTEVGATGLAVDDDRTWKSNLVTISKLIIHKVIQYRLLDVTSVCIEVKPIRADVLRTTRTIGVPYSSKRDKRRDMTNAVVISDFGTVLATGVSKFWARANIDCVIISVAVMNRAITRLLQKGSSELIWIVRINWSWISTLRGIQASECFGIVTGVKLVCDSLRKVLKPRHQSTTKCIEAGTAIFGSVPRWECDFNDGAPIGLVIKAIFQDWNWLEWALS